MNCHQPWHMTWLTKKVAYLSRRPLTCLVCELTKWKPTIWGYFSFITSIGSSIFETCARSEVYSSVFLSWVQKHVMQKQTQTYPWLPVLKYLTKGCTVVYLNPVPTWSRCVPTTKIGAWGAWTEMELSQKLRPACSWPNRMFHTNRYTARLDRKNWNTDEWAPSEPPRHYIDSQPVAH